MALVSSPHTSILPLINVLHLDVRLTFTSEWEDKSFSLRCPSTSLPQLPLPVTTHISLLCLLVFHHSPHQPFSNAARLEMTDTRIAWQSAGEFVRVGQDVVAVLQSMMQPRTDRAARFVARLIQIIREHKSSWDFRRTLAGISDRQNSRWCEQDAAQGRMPFTPWTDPTIDDICVVVEVLLQLFGNARLSRAMRLEQTD